MQAVTVTAKASAYRSTVDAKSYSLGADLKTGTGSLADVLRDVPSVGVDMEGNVSLRGNSDVTILVDGKPSALFSGPGRAQAIQGMSADQFERVEVMTSPSASQTASGSGGVINLISKHPPKAGAAPSASGTLKAELGTGNRYDVGVNGAYASGRLSLSGGVDFRQEGASAPSERATGSPTRRPARWLPPSRCSASTSGMTISPPTRRSATISTRGIVSMRPSTAER